MIRKYWTIFVLCLTERFTYRTDFLLGTLMRFLPIVTTIFLWSAIFEGSDREVIGLFTRNEMVAYYLLVTVARAFSSMPGLTGGIARDIRDGAIKKFLTQPVSMLGFLVVSRLAHKLVYYVVAAFPFALLFYLCRGYFSGWPSLAVLTAFLLSLLLAFLIGFLFETFIGLLAFWTLETSAFSFIIYSLNYVLSGHWFPLDLLPGGLATFVKALPFQYLAYFPAKLFLHGHRMSNAELLEAMGWQALYSLALFVLVQVTWRLGLRRYSAFGG